MPRKSKYTPERVERICKAIEDGSTYEDAAKIGGIAESTFFEWLNNNAEFLERVKRAKESFEEWERNDILAAAKKSLKTCILGQDYEEVKTVYEPDADGTPRIKQQVRTTKRIPPSVTALIFALCNRDPEHWQNRVNTESTVKVEEKKSEISLANVPDELLEKLADYINGEK